MNKGEDMVTIELKNVSKFFGKKKVIDEVSYTFEAGKVYGIVGVNGCGKSVLFKMISGLMKLSTGEIIVSGIKVGEKGKMPHDIGILIEHPGFLPDITGMKNLKELASIKNIINERDIEEVLKQVSLFKDKDVKVKHYSLGMLQRLGIAQALMESPKILLLDEPFNSMDEQGVIELRSVVKNYVLENGATLLVSSHNKQDIDFLADEVLFLEDGKLKSAN